MAVRQMSEAEIDKTAVDTGKELSAQPKVKVKIPLDAETKRSLENKIEAGQKVEWPAEQVWVNGYQYVIQKGKEVEVPQTVAEILEQSGMI